MWHVLAWPCGVVWVILRVSLRIKSDAVGVLP
ncbi:hypothetical protein FRC0190_02366 [Corynebacterium rouxii]|uniref:Uncharacterized protein n=1 Tax=Corynebacterium rouxii TaxID=2719119 RepID=A0A6I8MF19_9CORY|nr:hypothetical protein FRC0190_02366 [Corynebacterium rouxii]